MINSGFYITRRFPVQAHQIHYGAALNEDGIYESFKNTAKKFPAWLKAFLVAKFNEREFLENFVIEPAEPGYFKLRFAINWNLLFPDQAYFMEGNLDSVVIVMDDTGVFIMSPNTFNASYEPAVVTPTS